MQPLRRSLPHLLLAAACAAPASTPAPTRDDGGPPFSNQDLAAQAGAALERGELRAAHDLLREQLIRDGLVEVNSLADGGDLELALASAQALLSTAPADARAQDALRRAALLLGADRYEKAQIVYAAGDIRAALTLLDQAVTLNPQSADAHALRGACCLALGAQDGEPMLFEDALRELVLAANSGERPDAWIGASRAARLLYYDGFNRTRIQEAILLAREGVRAVEAGTLDPERLVVLPSQVLAEACFDLYKAAREAEEAETAGQAAAETRTALETCIGARPEDPWAWLQLASLLEWQGQPTEGRDVLRNALSLLPGNDALHSDHARLSRTIGGYAEVVSAYAHLLAEHPDSALGHWYHAVDSFELALAGVDAGEDQRANFTLAETSFHQCRALEAAYAESCRGYEVMCRAGAGLSMFHAGEIAEAQNAFLSMEQVFEGGLAWSIDGRMSSGLVYLDYVVGHQYQRQLDQALPAEERRAALLEAAALAFYLHGYDPTDGRRANDAGFLNRDAGVALEQEAERVLRASMTASDDSELAQRSRSIYALARGHMSSSFEAYAVAARLLSGDARVVNDTGLILTYYLQGNLDQASNYHLTAIAAGRAQLKAIAAGRAEADPDCTTAIGDAYQNLGYLDLTLRGASGAAREWFRHCVEFDPAGRELIHQVLLPLCDLLEAGAITPDEVRSLYRWGADDAGSLRTKDALRGRIAAAAAAATTTAVGESATTDAPMEDAHPQESGAENTSTEDPTTDEA